VRAPPLQGGYYKARITSMTATWYCSPQLNPVEHIWDEIREKWFANEDFNSLDAVEDRLVEALVALENDRDLVASTTGFDWIINCL
jgi:hypothetical protein